MKNQSTVAKFHDSSFDTINNKGKIKYTKVWSSFILIIMKNVHYNTKYLFSSTWNYNVLLEKKNNNNVTKIRWSFTFPLAASTNSIALAMVYLLAVASAVIIQQPNTFLNIYIIFQTSNGWRIAYLKVDTTLYSLENKWTIQMSSSVQITYSNIYNTCLIWACLIRNGSLCSSLMAMMSMLRLEHATWVRIHVIRIHCIN